MSEKLAYLASSVRKTLSGTGFSCPSCGCKSAELVRRKYLVTALRRCGDCRLLFRTPTTSTSENQAFYQETYTQGFTTDCPSDAALADLLKTGFAGSIRDYSAYVGILRASGVFESAPRLEPLRLFEFGCSWGYGSWQFAKAGFEVEAYEISKPRAKYAQEKLGVKVHPSLAGIKGGFDVFFSSHVLEHVPSVREALDFGLGLLKPGGLLVAITPNGSRDFQAKAADEWNKLWGLVHPNFLDSTYYEHRFSQGKYLLQSNPYDPAAIASWSRRPMARRTSPKLDGDELLVLAKKA